jgi:hypothetical protein
MKCLTAILSLAMIPVAAIAFDQKITTRYALDSTQVPREILAGGQPTEWTADEPGPVPHLKEFARSKSGVVWLGGDQGAARFDPRGKHRWDHWQYFWGQRWLPDNHIKNIWIDDAAQRETVWLRTKTGVSRIEWKPMTLGEKAAHYDSIIEQRHLRHGFVAKVGLNKAGDLSSSVTLDNDNDGLWSAMYLAAQAYRYAATKDPDARMKARRTLDALIRLEEINPMPGFYARSFKHIDEPSPDARNWGKKDGRWIWLSDADENTLTDREGEWIETGPGVFEWREHADLTNWVEHSGEWHATDDGQWLWKADTSSDETIGHYLAYALYFDLVADDAEKKIIQDKVRLITDRMISDDFYLLDLDGKPTRWGNWNESYYRSVEGAYERALRSVELLSFLKAAYHITGDEKYQKQYLALVDRGDIEQTSKYRRWESEFTEINFSDDELYYLSVLPLMMYEDDPKLREQYLEGMRFTADAIASDMNPLWNYINAACGVVTLTPQMKDDSKRTLERTPWEMIEWRVENSQRIDFTKSSAASRKGQIEFTEVIPPDERPIHKHNSSPYAANGGANGHAEESPGYWLLPYWMGRYHGWIE